MEEYRTYRLGEIAECTLGKMLDQKKNKGKPQVYLGNVAVRWGAFNIDYSQTMLFEDKELERYQAIKGDIVLCEGGEPGRCAIWEEERPICLQKALHRIRVNQRIADPYYVYYYLTSFVKSGNAEPYFTGSTIKHLPRERLVSLEMALPSLDVQKRRARIIQAIDDKITLNNRINHNLEEQAQALYKSWFLDFEPFKDGIFIDSELGMIPEGWHVKNLLEIANLFDSKRKPLSGNERSKMDKVYPYYGATSIMDYVDDYIFDGTYLLMGEDGSVMTEDGFPFLQYVTGKFWPNNHAHVMQGCSGFSTEMLHCALLRKVIKSSVTGAVQAKISQANMKKILFACPPRNILAAFDTILQKTYSQMRNISSQNATLSLVRDNLLPHLMSSKLGF